MAEAKMVDMSRTEAEKKKAEEQCKAMPCDGPDYPWGLCINLGKEELDKLGVKDLPKVGAEFLVFCEVTVTRVSQSASEGGDESKSVELQITEMGMEPEGVEDDETSPIAKKFYGKGAPRVTSEVDIANLALSSIGTRSTISDFNEQSVEANQVRLQYAVALDATLEAAHWNFARSQVALTLLKDATATPADAVPSPWLYEYAYPANCVQVRYIMPSLSGNPSGVPGAAAVPLWSGPTVRFLISSDVDSTGNDVKVILTNQPAAQAVFTKRVTNVQMFDGMFTRALSEYLGSLIAMPLTGDRAKAKAAFELANRRCIEAQASNGDEGVTVIDSVPDWIAVRGYASDWSYPPGSMNYQGPQALTLIT